MSTDMFVLVFAAQKGGVGKSTLAGHVATAAHLAGAGPVGLIDRDPQGSLQKWMEVRSLEGPTLFQSDYGGVGPALREAAQAGIKLAIVDTPPAVTRAISEIVSFADMVVVPTRPSPHDLRAVGPTVDIAQWHDKPMVFVVNAATARSRITADAAVALSQHGTVAPVTLHHRVDFAASMIDGRTVMETKPNGKSAEEVEALWTYLADRIDRLRPAHTNAPSDACGGHGPGNFNALGRQAPAFGRRAGH